jgi:PAS domain S-box-containing protein
MEDLTLVVDARDHLVDFNPSVQAAIGIDPRRATGRTLEELPPPWSGVFAPYSGLSSARDTIQVELPTGMRWYHLTVLPLCEESGASVGRLFHLHDITERKRVEEALRKSQEQIAQSQKMEAIGRLAGGIAHDFNNMLQVLLGYCATMRSHPHDQDTILNDVGAIEDSVKRAAWLTHQLLAFSRKQVVQPAVIDIGELLQQSQKMLSRVLGENVSLTVLLGAEASRARVDPAQMQQVIMNLVLNARDAMPDGGKIIISIENVSLPKGIEQEIPPGDYLRLTVSDTGCGMDANTMDHFFEPFFTTKGVGQGTGLGLSIVYGIVKECGGYIKVESRISIGSTFTIHLPRVFGPADNCKAGLEEERSGGPASILIVEDDATVRKLVRMILENAGYTVTEAESGGEALEACRAHDEGFDLLITDVVLTGTGGPEIANSVRHYFPKVRVIYMSGHASKDDILLRESLPFLRKPFSSAELLAQVKKTL